MAEEKKSITSMLDEKRQFPPVPEFVEKAHVKSLDEYMAMHKKAEDDFEGFWGEQAENYLTWYKKWDNVLEGEMPAAKWFTGGKLNIAYNCLDRHIDEGKGDKVAIIFTDITRASPDELLVPALLAELEAAGVRDEDVTLLCGIGMHRPSTPEEKVTKLGQAVVERYRVIDNEPQNPDALVDLGVVHDIPLSVHRVAYEADLLIATGSVDPHQYAGYSGGPKTVAVGAAGEPLIAYSHGPAFMDDPNVRLGKLAGNPFQEAISEAASRAGLRFIVNVVLDDESHFDIPLPWKVTPRRTATPIEASLRSSTQTPMSLSRARASTPRNRWLKRSVAMRRASSAPVPPMCRSCSS